MNYHSISIEEVFKNLKVTKDGLLSEQIEEKISQYGKNILPEKKKAHPIIKFLAQFVNVFALILIVAAVISFIFENQIDSWVIVTILFLNAIIGFVEEYRAERAIDALKGMVVKQAKVIRDGILKKVRAEKIVPGDILFLEEGDNISADARVFETNNLRTAEASLTGESTPIEKTTATLKGELALADRTNLVFMGTSVVGGNGKAIVFATGKNTALGNIAGTVSQIKQKKTHYQESTTHLAWVMGSVAVAGTIAIFLVGYFINHFPILELALFSIASLISGIPEGLPAVLIIVLAIGAYRMARRNAVIRHLPSTETLSVVTVIATDKTGTLTQNSMTIRKIITGDGDLINVSGIGWEGKGDFSQNGKNIIPAENPALAKLMRLAMISSAARVYKTDDQYEIVGDPTEAAFIVLGEKAGYKQEQINEETKLIAEIPFDSDKKYQARLFDYNGGREIVLAGAFENVLSLSTHYLDFHGEKKILTEKIKKELLDQADKLALDALRVLGIAFREEKKDETKLDVGFIKELTLLGLFGMIDPPREGVKEAIAKARSAGIRIIMKTGDHKKTALAIAREIGLVDLGYAEVYTETELVLLNQNEFDKVVARASIFARVTPETKHRITLSLQKQGEVVAVTGDGVNDAPSLRQADLGIAMGKSGTDVAREASEMVLIDDNFASIINAIEEARTVFRNVRQTSAYVITTNFAEIITLAVTMFLGLPLPLIAIQILWLNIVSESMVTIGLASEPKNHHILLEKPKKRTEPILSREIIPFIIIMVLIMVILTIPFFIKTLPEGLNKARAIVFTIMAWTQLWNVWNMRSLKESLFKLEILGNQPLVVGFLISAILQITVVQLPFFQNIFSFTPLNLIDWVMLIGLSSTVLWIGEGYKFIRYRKERIMQTA